MDINDSAVLNNGEIVILKEKLPFCLGQMVPLILKVLRNFKVIELL